MLHKKGIKYIFVTRGKKGILASDRASIYRIGSYKLGSVKNTTGAGDAVTACILYGLIKNYDMKKILEMAVVAGSNHVNSKYIGAKSGNPTLKEIKKFLREHRKLPIKKTSIKKI